MKTVAGRELDWAADQFRDRVALVFGERRYNYRQLDARVNRLANGLRDRYLVTGGRLAVLLDNSIEAVESLLAASKAGLAHVSLNTRHSVREHAEILRDSEASVLIVDERFRAMIAPIREQAPGLTHVIGVGWQESGVDCYEALLENASDLAPRVEVDCDTVHRIVYTSGTTGKPKGIVYTQASYRQRLDNFFAALEYRLGVEDSIIHVGPLSHAAGNYLIPYYLRGARNIVHARFDPASIVETIERERVTHLFLVPVMVARLLDYLDAADRVFDLSSLNRINYGTAPTSEALLRRGIRCFGHIFRQHLGMSECPQPLAVLYPHEHVLVGDENAVRRLRSCGRPTLNVEITIRDQCGSELSRGQVGEIAIAARGVADVQYWRRPELHQKFVRDGWFYTGDRGWMDEAGYLFIVGRSNDMIISGGFNIYPREVEDALLLHADVGEAAVVGVPDDQWGESICAFIVPRSDCFPGKEELIQHCRQHVASYKKPRWIHFLDALPRNTNGKLDQTVLRNLARSHTEK